MANKEVDILLNAVKAAGAVILDVQKQGFNVVKKANNDVVTEADLAANKILREHLLGQFPSDGWLSEECLDNTARLQCKRVWIVDPIDGTREFAQGIPEYAVSVALVENNRPVLAAVYNPATRECFHAIKGEGAWLNNETIYCNRRPSFKTFTLLASRSEYKRGEWNRFNKIHQVQQVGSIAYKLALLAAGKAHATFSLTPKNEWDIAAGALIVTEAGGVISNKFKTPLRFNQKEVSVAGVVASIPDINHQIFSLIQQA